ncbi:MAG: glutaredoxin-like protein [Parcubacteria group bacterium Gr01-1014_18]|nr:MAG: glutaredoxin-like protein [Parcubacteria group bacterium Greene0416_36]TSC80211.1 MAG: glutaredoxin-like protein [Parcubacteria group bacterium Gr01-1014_18]TSC98393.1 MAG: glutaredoxin-like protein [Parcubacteria group bacterium Greene1014_20]TSD06934.1 MAG: glutaredoxin-like protein [Parcubacteria group bacterium Greene0714_2]
MKKVMIYSTPTCGFCSMAKEFFKENKVEYEDVDVSQDQDKAREMIAKSGQMGVPVIAVSSLGGKEEVVIGFDKERLAGILGL